MIHSTLAWAARLACIAFVATSNATAADPATRPAPPAEARMDVFLLVGQSNMAGRGKVEAQDRIVDPNVWMLDPDGAWVPAVDPMHLDKPKNAGVGPGRTFGIAYAKAHPGAIVGLVPSAVGGTSLDRWKPDGTLYDDAVRRAKVALAHGTLRGILWHQGESDTKPEKIATYPARLDALVARLRGDLNAPDVPLVVGQIGVFDPVKNAARVPFNEMIVQYPDGRANVACVTAEGLTSVGDDTHFDAASQRELGRRYAAALQTLEVDRKDRP